MLELHAFSYLCATVTRGAGAAIGRELAAAALPGHFLLLLGLLLHFYCEREGAGEVMAGFLVQLPSRSRICTGSVTAMVGCWAGGNGTAASGVTRSDSEERLEPTVDSRTESSSLTSVCSAKCVDSRPLGGEVVVVR